MTTAQATTAVQYQPGQGPPVEIQVTGDQLHGLVCVLNTNHDGALAPAGHVYTQTSGAALGWPVVACAGGCQPGSES